MARREEVEVGVVWQRKKSLRWAVGWQGEKGWRGVGLAGWEEDGAGGGVARKAKFFWWEGVENFKVQRR